MDNVITGRKPVRELLEASPDRVEQVLIRQGVKGQDIKELVDICGLASVRCRFLPGEAMERLVPGCRQGVAAFVLDRGLVSLEDLLQAGGGAALPVVLALDQVQDPGNVGSLARTLLALGGAGMIVPRHHGARLGGAASRTSAGALERLPVHQGVNLGRDLEVCLEAGFTVYKAEPGPTGNDVFKTKFEFPLVLVLGGEEKGIRFGVAKHCHQSIYIPMPGGFESLNVAQAGAVILGQMARQAFGAH
jgi:23S rRNA (guanosine2251-2'-O)-methyltransferase